MTTKALLSQVRRSSARVRKILSAATPRRAPKRRA